MTPVMKSPGRRAGWASGSIRILEAAKSDIIRIALDSDRDVEALRELRSRTDAVLSVDLQENYRLAERVAPYVDKIRYNPGHLHHHEKGRSIADKVRYLVDVARADPLLTLIVMIYRLRKSDGQSGCVTAQKISGGVARGASPLTRVSARASQPT